MRSNDAPLAAVGDLDIGTYYPKNKNYSSTTITFPKVIFMMYDQTSTDGHDGRGCLERSHGGSGASNSATIAPVRGRV